MALAEPRRRSKLSADPNNTAWGGDTERYGHKLLEKMGWSSGTGLGRNKDGRTSHVKVRVKNNSLGVGAQQKHDDNWLDLQASFNNLLENLATAHTHGIDQSALPARSRLEEKAGASRRMFYSRFVRSKDTSKYSDSDMASILGSRTQSPAASEPATDTEENVTSVPTTTSSMSISDYFAMKMAQRKAGQAPGEAQQQGSDEAPAAEAVEPEEEGHTTEDEEGKKKKKGKGEVEVKEKVKKTIKVKKSAVGEQGKKKKSAMGEQEKKKKSVAGEQEEKKKTAGGEQERKKKSAAGEQEKKKEGTKSKESGKKKKKSAVAAASDQSGANGEQRGKETQSKSRKAGQARQGKEESGKASKRARKDESRPKKDSKKRARRDEDGGQEAASRKKRRKD